MPRRGSVTTAHRRRRSPQPLAAAPLRRLLPGSPPPLAAAPPLPAFSPLLTILLFCQLRCQVPSSTSPSSTDIKPAKPPPPPPPTGRRPAPHWQPPGPRADQFISQPPSPGTGRPAPAPPPPPGPGKGSAPPAPPLPLFPPHLQLPHPRRRDPSTSPQVKPIKPIIKSSSKVPPALSVYSLYPHSPVPSHSFPEFSTLVFHCFSRASFFVPALLFPSVRALQLFRSCHGLPAPRPRAHAPH